jgi:ParB family chromosome partitioning protein
MKNPNRADGSIIQIPIQDIEIGERHRKDLGDLDGLAASMRDSPCGMLQPILVSKVMDKFKLRAGHRRLEAAKLLGWTTVPCIIVKLENALDALIAERDENTCRKDFTPSEAVAIGKAIEAIESEAAKERQEASRAKKGEKIGQAQGGDNLPPPSSNGKTRDKIAAAVGMSASTYEKAKAVVKAAEEEPEKFTPILKTMDKTGKVDPAYRRVKRPVADVVESWQRQKDERADAWVERLKKVGDKEKKGNKLAFDRLLLKAKVRRDDEQIREENLERRRERFNVPDETEAVFQWLTKRREKWPEKFRHEFTTMVRTIVERLEAQDNAQKKSET